MDEFEIILTEHFEKIDRGVFREKSTGEICYSRVLYPNGWNKIMNATRQCVAESKTQQEGGV